MRDGLGVMSGASCRARAVGRRVLLVGIAITALTIMSPTAGRAGSSDGVIVTARSLEPIPAGASIFVKVLDNSTANLQLRNLIKRELAAQRRTLTDEAPLVLRFTTDHLQDTQTLRYRETLVSVPQYRLHVSLEWHETGQVLWRGDAVASLSGTDERMLGPQLVVALIEQLGRTVEPPH
jgi:hypothetical protein